MQGDFSYAPTLKSSISVCQAVALLLLFRWSPESFLSACPTPASSVSLRWCLPSHIFNKSVSTALFLLHEVIESFLPFEKDLPWFVPSFSKGSIFPFTEAAGVFFLYSLFFLPILLCILPNQVFSPRGSDQGTNDSDETKVQSSLFDEETHPSSDSWEVFYLYSKKRATMLLFFFFLLHSSFGKEPCYYCCYTVGV